MKFALLIALIAATTALAEDAVVETQKTDTATEAHRAEQRKMETEKRVKKALEESPVTYSGFLVELSRSEKKSRFLSLRQPADSKNDYKYVHFDEKTSRPKGFTLFSLDF